MKWGHSSVRSSETKESNRLKTDTDLKSAEGVASSNEVKISENLAVPIIPFSIEEARVHAHLCGDGCVWREVRKRSPADLRTHKRKNVFREFWLLNYTNTCKQLRNEFKKDMLEAFKRRLTVHEKIDLRTNSVKNILYRLKLIGKNSYNWFIPEELLFANKEAKKFWLRAFFDDESTVDIEKKSIRLKIVNKNGLIQIQKLLMEFGIESNITGPNCDNTWFLNIRHENIFKFHNLIGFNHPKQKGKLKKSVHFLKIKSKYDYDHCKSDTD